MIKLSYISEYVLLAENLNFSKTAEMSYITQPALSRHISILEEEMGAKLLERTTRTVKLTPAGERVYESFRSMLMLYDRAKDSAKSFAEVPKGNLHINSPYYWTGDYTEPLLETFRKAYPECAVSIHSCQPLDGFAGLEQGKCDLFISIDIHKISPPVRGIPFANEELQVFMLADHPLAAKESIVSKDFHNETYIYTKGFEEWKNQNLEQYSRQGIFPSEVICCEQIDALGMILQQKGGMCILPYGVRHMDRPYIVSRPFEPAVDIDMCLFYRQDTSNPMVEKFLGIL